MSTIFLLDNYDSFTYNLVDQFKVMGHDVIVYRNTISADFIINKMKNCTDAPILVLSPGPGNPTNAGCLMELISKCRAIFPIIGICLGHQAICQYYGASIGTSPTILHGKVSKVYHENQYFLRDMPNPLNVARYHSLAAYNLPKDLEIIAKIDEIPMAVVNKKDKVVGLQFHPESIMTTDGATLLNNIVKFVSKDHNIIKNICEKLYNNQNLSKEETINLFTNIFNGEMDPFVLSSVLTSLKQKGETVDEIAGAATAMLNLATPFERLGTYEVGEIVGTGGDGQNTINISTISSIVASSLGLHIAKHGNRSVSSKTGASDILKQLNINITMTPKEASKSLNDIGLTFLFAPTYHKGMKYAAQVRNALGTKTIFNILGPLSNPAHADYILMGVYSKELVLPMAKVLQSNGIKRAIVACGTNIDEIAIHANTYIAEVKENGEIKEYTLSPLDLGLTLHPIDAIQGSTPEINKDITLAILNGNGTAAQNCAVAINTGALLYLGKKTNTIKEGVQLALEQIQSGNAFKQLEKFQKASNRE